MSGERLRLAIRGRRTQDEFAQEAGISRTSLNRYFTGADPGDALVDRFATILGWPVAKLVGGAVAPTAPETIDVPVYDLQVAAGAGRISDRLQVVFQWPFPRWWAEANLPDASALMTFRVAGDSQWPELSDGDLVVADTRSRRANGELHVVRVDDTLKLKRIERDGSTIRLISRNELYPDELVDLAAGEEAFEIIGRAVTAIKLY